MSLLNIIRPVEIERKKRDSVAESCRQAIAYLLASGMEESTVFSNAKDNPYTAPLLQVAAILYHKTTGEDSFTIMSGQMSAAKGSLMTNRERIKESIESFKKDIRADAEKAMASDDPVQYVIDNEPEYDLNMIPKGMLDQGWGYGPSKDGTIPTIKSRKKTRAEAEATVAHYKVMVG